MSVASHRPPVLDPQVLRSLSRRQAGQARSRRLHTQSSKPPGNRHAETNITLRKTTANTVPSAKNQAFRLDMANDVIYG
ncbi:hypothetical protein V1281_000318 [Nitrobacteraceae bacterium AZCC 2161]